LLVERLKQEETVIEKQVKGVQSGGKKRILRKESPRDLSGKN